MLGTIDEVVFDCRSPRELAIFWAKVLGGEPVGRSESWWYIDPPGWTRVAFQKVPEEKVVKNRVHLDVLVDDVAWGADEAVRLGAVKVDGIISDSEGSFQVLLDPEGNEWCVVRSAADA
ncbi:VOC family protein [Antrihabitans sp. YC2-6]|uniref:VOC family protein n=1 Tax=Antrihabitans sp. YC2-6 TaxID=2799498 RepID=UPI0018F394DE|nr:VOC family protein [Antrihabitans sp. YC2-6]MBJ8343676.1 VOC family protein [Antrihabitans sp. YC2-6]